MLPTSEQYRYITEGDGARSVALEKGQRIYARPIDLDGTADAAAAEKLHALLAPLYERQVALAKSGRILEAEKIEAEIGILLKEQAPEAVKGVLPEAVDKDGRDARKIVSYVLATALVNYVNKDIYDGCAHGRGKNGEIVPRELRPHERTFKDYLRYRLNRAADGSFAEEEKPVWHDQNADRQRRDEQARRAAGEQVVRRNFEKPRNRKKALKVVEKKGRPLTEKEIKVMKLKAVGGKGK